MRANKLLTPEEAAEYLSVSLETVRRWTRQKRIPFIKLNGHLIRIQTADLDHFVKSQRVIPVEDMGGDGGPAH
jgi:excisionase family DNA binding protein